MVICRFAEAFSDILFFTFESDVLGARAASDFASPRTRLGPAGFDKFLETLQVAFNAHADDTDRAADIFDKAVRFVFQTDIDACA